jgi:hypothetical protein
MGVITALAGDSIVERVFENPYLRTLLVTSSPFMVDKITGPMLRINTRRVTVYHYLTFTGIEASSPLAFSMIRDSLSLSLLYLFIVALIFGSILWFVVLKRSTFDWWSRVPARFTIILMTTMVIFGGEQILGTLSLGLTSPFVIFVIATTLAFFILAIISEWYEPGPVVRLLQFASRHGPNWFTAEDALARAQIGRLNLDLSSITTNLIKMVDMDEMEMRLVNDSDQDIPILEFRRHPGRRPID